MFGQVDRNKKPSACPLTARAIAWPRILDRVFEGDFSMQAAYKDIVNVQQLAARLDASTPVVDAMVSTYDTAIEMGFGAQPKSAMVKVYEGRLGLEVRSPTSSRPGKAGDS